MRLDAPKAMLSDVLYVELDDVVQRESTLHIAGSVANLTNETIWIAPNQWRFESDEGELKPLRAPTSYEIPGYGVAYVRLTFGSRSGSGMLVVRGVYRKARPPFPAALGAIPIGVLPEDAARAVRPAPAADQPKGRELLERDCGSGPLVTCPR